MTDTEINMAVAEACGWEIMRPVINQSPLGRKEPGKGGWTSLPNYAGNLNATHEAEKVLTREQQIMHGDLLACECGYGTRNEFNFFDAAHATARQRAEALLLTLRKRRDQ